MYALIQFFKENIFLLKLTIKHRFPSLRYILTVKKHYSLVEN